MDSESFRPAERAREIRDLCRQIADVRARGELEKIASEYELLADALRGVKFASLRKGSSVPQASWNAVDQY